jgi:hypothetical protein
MNRVALVLAVLWGLLGLGLVIDGVVESSSWTGDPGLAGSSLRWWHSTLIVPGVVAMLFAILLPRGGLAAAVLGYPVAAIFTLYVVYILLLTPSTRLLQPMLALQALVLGLTIATVVYLIRGSRNAISKDV